MEYPAVINLIFSLTAWEGLLNKADFRLDSKETLVLVKKLVPLVSSEEGSWQLWVRIGKRCCAF